MEHQSDDNDIPFLEETETDKQFDEFMSRVDPSYLIEAAREAGRCYKFDLVIRKNFNDVQRVNPEKENQKKRNSN